ncbi:MAG: CehA/McbA family metallohydrolase [Candidatus Hydrogenedentes bacterium]|nr:CehA/McbA family metallohydrolase [Candidatus Hydrogenedentota bacterium]
MRIVNPYLGSSTAWMKGNLHTHTTNSDGPHSPQATIGAYAELGYDFLMLSDHDRLTDAAVLDPRGMVLIPGNEITADGPHVLHVGARSLVSPHSDRQRVFDAIRAQGGFAVCSHPNWEPHFNHCPQKMLMAWTGYTGIEIYNGVVEWLEGNPCATDRWDQLLAAGKRVWGFAHDDCHRAEDLGIAWLMLQSREQTPDGVVDALRNGRFYASTGVAITSIRVRENHIRVETGAPCRISALSDYGYRRAMADGTVIEFEVPPNPRYTYIRVECAGNYGRMAWTQPFFLDR